MGGWRSQAVRYWRQSSVSRSASPAGGSRCAAAAKTVRKGGRTSSRKARSADAKNCSTDAAEKKRLERGRKAIRESRPRIVNGGGVRPKAENCGYKDRRTRIIGVALEIHMGRGVDKAKYLLITYI